MRIQTVLACCLASTALATDLIEVRVRTSANKEVGVLVYLDELARTHRSAALGISASITDKGVYCQAFSDPHGRDELGSPFSVGDDVVFSSKNQKPVRIASFYCSDSVDKLEGPGLKPLSGKQGDGDDDKEKTVRIQFRTGYDKFTQGDIKLGEVVSLEDTKLGDSVVEAMVVSATGNVYWGKVQCQLYEDEDGKDKLGDAFTVYGETYGTEPQKATAVRCED